MAKTVIFDFDGTLADSFELVMDIVYELTDMQPLSEEEVQRLRRLPLMKAIREAHIPLLHVPRLLLHGRQIMFERMAEVKAIPGVTELLAELHVQGHHLLVISTNSEQNVRSFLRSHGLEHYFAGVYGGVGVFDKAAALRKVLRRNRIDATETYYIGDEVRDIMAAKKVSVTPIAVSWGYQDVSALREHQPFAIAEKPADVLAAITAGTV